MFSKSLFKKMADNRKKNTVRKITQETKEYIIERDRVCIICEHEYITEYHHVFYWNQAIYTENRNDPDQLVWLCHTCHYKTHFQWDNDYREKCINYLTEYYAKPNI